MNINVFLTFAGKLVKSADSAQDGTTGAKSGRLPSVIDPSATQLHKNLAAAGKKTRAGK